jgi:alginate O-acetyltransferase complex protein AlgI
MIFSSLTFFIFFAIVIIFLLVLKNQKAKKIMLLAASYFFYGYWDYRFLSLIIFTSILDYFVGKKISKINSPSQKKILLAISIFVNLGILAFFKYFNFFIESANVAFGDFGLNLSTLNIILPVGLSFYTFQSMSYTIDVYRDKSKYCSSTLDFLLFIAFFPQLVAGPIVRASDFLPQLKKKIELRADNFRIGIQIFIFGLIKKVIIADRVAFFVDGVFKGPELFDSWTIWLAVIAYSIQIYCDFSGYSDMAIGLARIMGFDFMTNFNYPYIATNISDFWRRWHISLSTWLRDYLYIPLGGNKKGENRTYINLFLTMILGGLWNGASWNFVFWGFWHGTGLVFYRIFRKEFPPLKSKLTKITSWIFTYIFVLIGWVFFRSQSTEISIKFINKMLFFDNQGGIRWLYQSMFFILPLMIIAYIIGSKKLKKHYPTLDLLTFKGAFVLIFILLGLFYLSIKDANPFIYFQF